MAEQQATVSAPFPTPPPFYKHFTRHNVSRLRHLRQEHAAAQSDEGSKREVDLLSLPPELRYLIPPLPPADAKYRTFGSEIDLNAPDATLEEAGIKQLYPSDPSVKINPHPHLLALTRSLLTTFLDLVGVLSRNPSEYYEERVDSLQTIMYNIHGLINQYRPHQARESVAIMMEERIEAMKDEIQKIAEAKAKVADIMSTLQEGRDAQQLEHEPSRRLAGEGDASTTKLQDEHKKRAEQRAAWAAIREMVADPT